MKPKARNKRWKITNDILDNLDPQGIDEITIKTLCEAGGISVGTFYHYFGSKDSFVAQLHLLLDIYIEENILPQLTMEQESERFYSLCMGIMRFMHESGKEKCKLSYDIRGGMSYSAEQDRVIYHSLYDIFSCAKENGRLNPQYHVETLTRHIIIVMRGYLYSWMQYDENTDLIKMTDEMLTSVKKLIFTDK